MVLLALQVAGGLFKIGMALYEKFWSPSARMQQAQNDLALKIAAMQAEKARLKDVSAQIDKQPDKAGQSLIDDLNKKSGGQKP